MKSLLEKNNWLLWNFSHKRSPNKPWKLDDPLWYWRYFEGISIYGIFFSGCCHKISKFKWEWQNMLWEKIKTSTRISNLTKKVWILNFFRSIYDTTWALCLPVSTDPFPQPAAINSTQTLNFAQPCHFLWLKYKIFSYFHALKYFLGKSNWL